jgi:sulfonate transport system substrate-binding protein
MHGYEQTLKSRRAVIGGVLTTAVIATSPLKGAPERQNEAPIAITVPPGTSLVVGGPTLLPMFRLSGELARLPFKAEFTTFAGGPSVLDAFRANALDVAAGNDIPAIHETWLGFDVKIIAVTQRRNAPHPAQFGIAPGSNIRSLADLKGKKIAYSAGQAQGSLVLRVLKRYGINKSDVQLIPLPSRNDVYANALAARLVDAAPLGATVAAKHFIDKYGSDGAKLLVPDHIVENPGNLWVKAELLKDPAKAAAVKAYLKSYIRASLWVENHKEHWIDQFYIKDQGLSRADAEYVTANIGSLDILDHWDQAIRDEQDTINFMAVETGQKPFDAHRMFDRRFETVAAQTLREIKS